MEIKAKKLDFNSVENQEIKGRFVKREVLTCFSYEMDAVLKAGALLPTHGNNSNVELPTYEDIENLYEYKCPECGESQNTTDALYNQDKDRYICPECKCEIDDWESEPQEVYEWWIVTEYLYNKLKARGCVVLEWGNNCYWGRCTTGQSIMLDGVISDICSEMEILDGQKYSWGKK